MHLCHQMCHITAFTHMRLHTYSLLTCAHEDTTGAHTLPCPHSRTHMTDAQKTHTHTHVKRAMPIHLDPQLTAAWVDDQGRLTSAR